MEVPEKRANEPPDLSVTARRADAFGDPHADIFFALVETTRVPMIVTDPHLPDNPIVFVNRAFERMTGYIRAESIGANCRFLQGPGTDREAVREISRAVEERREMATEVLNYRKDGSSFWNALVVSPVFDRTGDLAYFVGSLLDVSQRREAEDALREARTVASPDALPDGIAHDLNNLLQVIGGHADMVQSMARKPNLDPARLARAGEAISRATDRASELNRRLLALTRKQRP